MIKVILHTLRTALHGRIRSLWEQILSFKRSSHFEKGRSCGEPLLDTVVSLFSVLATPLFFNRKLHVQAVRVKNVRHCMDVVNT